MNPASVSLLNIVCTVIYLYPLGGSSLYSLVSNATLLLIISLSLVSFHKVFQFSLSILMAYSANFVTRIPSLWVRFQWQSLTLEIILLCWWRYVGTHKENYGSLMRFLPLAHSSTCIVYDFFRSKSLSRVLVPLTHSTIRCQPLVSLLFSGAQFFLWMNPSSSLITFSSEQWYKISLNMMNSLPSESHEVKIDSENWFDDTYTPSPPDSTSSYTLVSKISLALRWLISSPSALFFPWATVARGYPYPLGRKTSIPT